MEASSQKRPSLDTNLLFAQRGEGAKGIYERAADILSAIRRIVVRSRFLPTEFELHAQTNSSCEIAATYPDSTS